MICFVHIERAGGTTIHHILRNNRPSFLTLRPSIEPDDPRHDFTPAQLRFLLRLLPFTAGFGGHHVRPYLRYEEVLDGPLQCIALLREPVGRYLSHLNYQLVRNPSATIEAFLREPRLGDLMTRRIAGRPDLARAERLLRERFAFVGLQERFDESVVLLRKALAGEPLDVRYETQNSSAEIGYHPALEALRDDPAFLERVRRRNQVDLQLYERFADQVFDPMVKHGGEELQREVEALRRANRGFRFPRTSRLGWAAYRMGIYQPLQRRAERTERRRVSGEATE